LRKCLRYAELRNNPGGVTLDSVQKSEFSVAEACRVRQHGLEHRLKLARRTADDLQHLGGCRLLLQRLGEFLLQLGVGAANGINAGSRLRCLRTKTGNACSALCPFASQDHLVGMVTGRPFPPAWPSQGSSLSILTEPHDELAPPCMTRKEHTERWRGSVHETASAATGSPQPLWTLVRE